VKIDISNLSASELDEFIAKAAERRYNMQPQLPGEPPQATQAIVNPAWYVTPIKEGTLLPTSHGRSKTEARSPR
jgi:hypothetical protein